MGQKLRLLESSPGIFWLLVILGVLSLVMLATLLVISLMYRPPANPEALDHFSRDLIRRAAEYNRLNMVLSASSRILVWMLMGAAVWVGWRYFDGNSRPGLYAAAAYIALFYIIINIIIIPLSFYRGYVIEHRFGLSNQTVAMWLADFAKSRGIDVLISVAGFTGLYALMLYIPRYWWLIAGSALAVFIVIGVYLYPVLIDPLFYRFRKLEDEVMRQEIMEVTEKAGIEVQDILIADASRKTSKANAYFTGFGNTRRIVLYDNLLDDFSRQQTLNVVAHEAAHWRYAHIVKNMAIGIAAGLAGLFILELILSRAGLKGDFRSIFIIILLISLISFLSMPAQNAVSRHFERQADRLTLELTGRYDAQIQLLKGLAGANLSNVDPHPVIRAVLYSHPPILERILSAEKAKSP